MAVITHNRYTRTDTFVRWGMAVACDRYKFVTVSLPKRLRDGRFTSETATWIQKWFKISAGASTVESFIYNSFSRRGRWAWLWKYV